MQLLLLWLPFFCAAAHISFLMVLRYCVCDLKLTTHACSLQVWGACLVYPSEVGVVYPAIVVFSTVRQFCYSATIGYLASVYVSFVSARRDGYVRFFFLLKVRRFWFQYGVKYGVPLAALGTEIGVKLWPQSTSWLLQGQVCSTD